MKHEQKAKEFVQKFYDSRPKEFLTQMDECGRGLYMILRMLNDSENEVLAGDISNTLKMSTPRVAAALNVLEKKGHITRTHYTSDKRKIVVCITESGRAALACGDNAVLEIVDYLIESVGERDLDEFIRISGKINKALDKRAKSDRGDL